MGISLGIGLGIDRVAGGGGPSPIVPTTGIIAANRGQYNTGVSSTLSQPYTSRRTHYAHAAGDISDLQTVDINRYFSSVSTTTTGSSHSIKRYIEYPEGTFTQVTWNNGSTTVTKAGGSRTVSDVIDITIPAGAKFWERTVVLSNAAVPLIIMPDTHAALGLDDGNASGDFGNTGTIDQGTNGNSIGCQAILGTVNASNARSFVIIGDSLAFGSLDITGVGSMESSGYVARMLDNVGIPYFKWAYGGMQAADAVTLSATLNADLAVMEFSDLICEYGLNDLRLGRSVTQILADHQTLYALSNIADKDIWQTTITPRTTSTDSWATTTNQTPQTDGTMADLDTLNADIRDVPTNVFGVIEAADAAMSARDSDIHKAPPAGTTDGTHFNSLRAAVVASLISVG